MQYCNICSNKKLCEENHWCVTMDKQRVLAETKEYLCDNFKTDKEVIILERN